jgi:hypothetical protein
MNSSRFGPYAVWLIPRKEQYYKILSLVDDLSERFGTARFQPHATLFSGDLQDDVYFKFDKLSKVLSTISPRIESIAYKIAYKDTFFQFFFIKLFDDPFRRKLIEARSDFNNCHIADVGLHVSLMYSDRFTDIDRSLLATEVFHRLPTNIVFDSIALVITTTGSWHDLNSWKICRSSPLLAAQDAAFNP